MTIKVRSDRMDHVTGLVEDPGRKNILNLRKKSLPLSTVAEELERNDVAIPLMRGMTPGKSIY